MDRKFLIIGALLGFFAVMAGSFGAHGLRGRITDDLLAVFEIGVRYHMYHALAMVFTAWAYSRWPDKLVAASGWLFLIGILIFSGSLYLLAITGMRWLGAITPLGGISLMAGWLCLALGVWRK